MEINYNKFKEIRLEFDKLHLAFPQDTDQMKGIRRDFALFQFVLGFKSSGNADRANWDINGYNDAIVKRAHNADYTNKEVKR